MFTNDYFCVEIVRALFHEENFTPDMFAAQFSVMINQLVGVIFQSASIVSSLALAAASSCLKKWHFGLLSCPSVP